MQATKIASYFLFLLFLVGCQTTTTSTRDKQKINLRNFDVYRVKQGDTLYRISKKFNTTIQKILIDNKIRSNKPIEVGQRIFVRRKFSDYIAPVKSTTYKPVSYRRTDSKYKPPQTVVYKKTKKKKTSVLVKGNPPYMLIPRGSGYTKPLIGTVVKKFSTYDGGRPLYGVNIKSSKHQSVKSIHNGVVVFTADSFANFGRCIMIAHSRKEKCFYYGLQSVTLKVGDVINRGFSIGKVKKQGTLGLKIMRNEYFVNPQSVIPRL